VASLEKTTGELFRRGGDLRPAIVVSEHWNHGNCGNNNGFAQGPESHLLPPGQASAPRELNHSRTVVDLLFFSKQLRKASLTAHVCFPITEFSLKTKNRPGKSNPRKKKNIFRSHQARHPGWPRFSAVDLPVCYRKGSAGTIGPRLAFEKSMENLIMRGSRNWERSCAPESRLPESAAAASWAYGEFLRHHQARLFYPSSAHRPICW